MQPVPQRLSRTEPQRPARRAFSMIELMVVITIIAILMSLLLVGIRSAMTAARIATVTVEFNNMEKAIADFKAKFGSEPPSGIALFEATAGWTGASPSTAAVNRSRALIRQIWPDFDFAIARDINGDGDMTDTITLNGAECLVFFLGGVNSTNVVDKTGATIGTAGDPITEWAPLGFSTNPANPFARGGARLGPYHDFNIGRLRNRDGATDAEGFPEYIDPLPGQTNPILYASSYGGKGYRDADMQFTSQAIYDAYATPPTGFAYYYRRYAGTTYPFPADASPNTDTSFRALPAFNEKSCQLISPGVDGEYGWGGVLSTGMEVNEPQQERFVERDNITNFKGGTLN
jgi:prepilin-type N-terminal cleavage/methylation domain-containing protein